MAAVDGEDSMQFLSSADPPLFLSPSPHLSRHARTASSHLFSSLIPFCPKPKPPLDELLVGESFDAEQIWCQIDLISRPIVSMLRREIKRIERDPPRPPSLKKEEIKVHEEEHQEEEEDDEQEEEEEEDDDDEDGEEEEEGDESDGDAEKEVNGVEDKFLKINELEEYLEKDEEREYGEIKGKQINNENEEDEDEDEEEEEDDEADSQVKIVA